LADAAARAAEAGGGLAPRRLRTRGALTLKLGINAFLVKPISPKALQDRLLSILMKPRAMVQIGKFYVPQPRRVAAQPA
jgi:hypothetical protein